ncbi:MAG: hypothetical protein HYW52_03010 [Gemmatimonadetes bacterium]|nr:hypothetical protein [Gemmatimonadota bacterium]
MAPDEMAGRMIVRGIVGCPVCRREYPITQGVVHFGKTAETAETAATAGAGAGAGGAADADPDVIWSLLGLASPGGFVVLGGSAARLAGALAERMGGVHLVGVNATAGVERSPVLTLLRHPSRIPLRQNMARGVVLGGEAAREPWISEGARVLLHGLRLVAAAETVSAPGLDQLAVGRGMWVGQKTGNVKRET